MFMKVQIDKIYWFSYKSEKGLQIQFQNEMIALIKDSKVAMKLLTLFFENENFKDKIFKIEFSQDGLDVILDSIVLVG